MDFYFEPNSPLAAHVQIIEQIKAALLLGKLRPGETLPSIRDLERDLGISRSIVRKAYLELEELGILKLIQGKGVMVNKDLRYKENRDLLENCERLVQTVRKNCQQKGLIFSSFARFLYQRAIEVEKEQSALVYVDVAPQLAKDRAAEVSRILQVNVEAISTEELFVRKSQIKAGTKILCNFFRLDHVTRILRGKKLAIIPLRMRLAEQATRELSELLPQAKILFLYDSRDQSATPLIIEDYRRAHTEKELQFVSRPVKDIARQIKAEEFAMIIISNRIWATLPEEIRQAKKVTHPILDFDPSSVEESRMQLGIIG
jgi:GntR family transcriptional regulator